MKNVLKHLFSLLLVLTVILFFQKNTFALIYPFNLTYSALQEVPPNASPATGTIAGTYDDGTKTISITINFSGLVANTTAAHFHAPAPIGVNAPVIISYIPGGFPLGVTSGTFVNSYILTAGQEANLFANLMYSNIHTSQFPGGEIRTQMILDAPLPVELSSFVSIVNRNDVKLNWTTVTEINNSGFDIERAVSNGEFHKVGFVAGNGNTSTQRNFSFTDKGLNHGTYNYRLKQIDFNGNFEYFNLSNEVNIGVPSSYSLSQNYPNPFNPSTKIDYELPSDGRVSIVLYDLSGKEVETMLNESRTAGYYSLNFNAGNLSSGIYFYKITANNFTMTKKMMLVK
jgi:hypothetical protein